MDGADGRHLRLLFAHPGTSPVRSVGPGTRAVLAVFALDQTKTRQIVHNELKVFAITLLVGAIASALLGVLIARRIVAAPRALAAAAGQIGRPPANGCRSRPRPPS